MAESFSFQETKAIESKIEEEANKIIGKIVRGISSETEQNYLKFRREREKEKKERKKPKEKSDNQRLADYPRVKDDSKRRRRRLGGIFP